MRIARCTSCRRNYTAEGVCVPCQREHGLPAVPYQVSGKSSATIAKSTTITSRTTISSGALARKPAPKPAPAAPERPQPQAHNLDAPGVREPLTLLEHEVFEAMCKGAFLTPECCWSETLLAERVGVSRRTITRVKPRLVAKGWITWRRVWRPGQRWQNCVYTILAGWHRPHRKVVLKWLDKRRSRARVSLNELPHRPVEKETQRSRGRRVRNGFSRPWEGWMRKPDPRIVIPDDLIARCRSREQAEAFATWAPAK